MEFQQNTYHCNKYNIELLPTQSGPIDDNKEIVADILRVLICQISFDGSNTIKYGIEKDGRVIDGKELKGSNSHTNLEIERESMDVVECLNNIISQISEEKGRPTILKTTSPLFSVPKKRHVTFSSPIISGFLEPDYFPSDEEDTEPIESDDELMNEILEELSLSHLSFDRLPNTSSGNGSRSRSTSLSPDNGHDGSASIPVDTLLADNYANLPKSDGNMLVVQNSSNLQKDMPGKMKELKRPFQCFCECRPKSKRKCVDEECTPIDDKKVFNRPSLPRKGITASENGLGDHSSNILTMKEGEKTLPKTLQIVNQEEVDFATLIPRKSRTHAVAELELIKRNMLSVACSCEQNNDLFSDPNECQSCSRNFLSLELLEDQVVPENIVGGGRISLESLVHSVPQEAWFARLKSNQYLNCKQHHSITNKTHVLRILSTKVVPSELQEKHLKGIIGRRSRTEIFESAGTEFKTSLSEVQLPTLALSPSWELAVNSVISQRLDDCGHITSLSLLPQIKLTKSSGCFSKRIKMNQSQFPSLEEVSSFSFKNDGNIKHTEHIYSYKASSLRGWDVTIDSKIARNVYAIRYEETSTNRILCVPSPRWEPLHRLKLFLALYETPKLKLRSHNIIEKSSLLENRQEDLGPSSLKTQETISLSHPRSQNIIPIKGEFGKELVPLSNATIMECAPQDEYDISIVPESADHQRKAPHPKQTDICVPSSPENEAACQVSDEVSFYDNSLASVRQVRDAETKDASTYVQPSCFETQSFARSSLNEALFSWKPRTKSPTEEFHDAEMKQRVREQHPPKLRVGLSKKKRNRQLHPYFLQRDKEKK